MQIGNDLSPLKHLKNLLSPGKALKSARYQTKRKKEEGGAMANETFDYIDQFDRREDVLSKSGSQLYFIDLIRRHRKYF